MRKLAATLLLCACSTSAAPGDGASSNPSDGATGGTDTGNPNDGEGTVEGGGLCSEVQRPVALDEVTPLGMSASDVFAWLSGTHEETLAWQDAAASFGPEHGSSSITLEIEPLAARFVDRSPASSGAEGGLAITPEIAGADPCADSIALDVRLHLSTAGGALDETLQTTLEARARDVATGQVSLPTDMLTGSFTVDVPVPDGFVARGAPRLNLELALSEYGDRGQLTLTSEFESSDGQAVGQGSAGVLARFPAGDTCDSGRLGVAASQSVRGVSIDAVLDSLNGSSPAQLGSGGATLELSFQSSAERVCLALDGPESGPLHLEFPGRVQLSSSDQRMAGAIDVSLAGDAVAGSLERSTATANAFVLDPTQASATVAQFAIAEPLDFSSYDGGSFQFRAEVSAGVASGSLEAFGVQLPECATTPQHIDPGAQSSPGCPGADLVPLWSASWSKP